MATKKIAAPDPDDRIIIERRILVAEIQASPYGDRSMLEQAAQISTEYCSSMADSHQELVEVQFNYNSQLFKISAEPEDMRKEG